MLHPDNQLRRWSQGDVFPTFDFQYDLTITGRTWLGSVLGAPLSSAFQELLSYRFNLQDSGIDWNGLDVVMLINELIKCYCITLSHAQPLGMNTKQTQSSESQV